MIDEKKLIEELDYYIWHTTESMDEHYAYRQCKKLVERQPKVGEWIPVSERLPKEMQRVLVQKVNGVIEVLQYYGETRSWGGDTYHNVHPRLIKAWQPLPKAYEVEK